MDQVGIKIALEGARQAAAENRDLAGSFTEIGGAGKGAAKDTAAFGAESTKASRGVGSLKGAIGGLGAALAGFGVSAGLGALVSASSDRNEELSKNAAIFGVYSPAIAEAAKNAYAFGQSQTEFLGGVSNLGGALKGFGVGQKAASEMGMTLTKLASDMASFNNTSVGDALAALQSGLAGESEPLRRFKVFLSDAALKQEALNLGLYKGKGNLTDNSRALATYALIMAKTKDQQGDFARTSTGIANTQRRLQGEAVNLAARWGNVLAPAADLLLKGLLGIVAVLGAVLTAGGAVYHVLEPFAPLLLGLAVTLGVLAAPLALQGAAWAVFGAALMLNTARTWAMTAAQNALNLAMRANPILLIASLLAGLGVALYGLWQRHEGFRNAVVSVWTSVKVAAVGAWDWIRGKWESARAFFAGIAGGIKSAFSGIWDGFRIGAKSAINFVIGLYNTGIDLINKITPGPLSVAGKTIIPAIPDIPHIPLLAQGGTLTGSGTAIVGDVGMERLDKMANGDLRVTPLENVPGGRGNKTRAEIVFKNGDAGKHRLFEEFIDYIEIVGAAS